MYFPNPFRLYNKEGFGPNINFKSPVDDIEKVQIIIEILTNLHKQGFDCLVDPSEKDILQFLQENKSQNEIIQYYIQPCIDEIDAVIPERCKPIDVDIIVDNIMNGKKKDEIVKQIGDDCGVELISYNVDEVTDDIDKSNKKMKNIKQLPKDIKDTISSWLQSGKLGWMIAGIIIVLIGVALTFMKTWNDLLSTYESGKPVGFIFKIKNLLMAFIALQIVVLFFLCIYIGIESELSFMDFLKYYTTQLYIFTIIVGSTLVLTMIPSFVEVFENTIGYYFTKTFTLNDDSNPFNNFRNKAFPNANIDLTFLLTLFNVENFDETFDIFMKTATSPDHVEEGIIFNDIEYFDEAGKEISEDKKSEIRKQLFNLTSGKHACGHLVWRTISTMLALLVTFTAL